MLRRLWGGAKQDSSDTGGAERVEEEDALNDEFQDCDDAGVVSDDAVADRNEVAGTAKPPSIAGVGGDHISAGVTRKDALDKPTVEHVATSWPRVSPSGSSSTTLPPLPWRRLNKAYCVNLDRRVERWSFMQRQFVKLQLPVSRHSAIDGQRVDVNMLARGGLVNSNALPRFFLPNEMKLFGIDLTPGGLGCALSHMQVWKDILENHCDGLGDGGCFLVVEDDCSFIDDFSEEMLTERIAAVPDDWQMIFLGGQDLLGRQDELEIAPGVRRLYRGFRETTAYLITAGGCKACLEVCTPLHWQIDTHLTENETPMPGKSDLGYTIKPLGYCLFPALVAQDREQFKTDVQKNEHS